jgi:protein-S-isoprenylcysteine O-methyltransferase Ste14
MMAGIKESIFLADVAINHILLFGVAWSIVLPEKRIWPPPKKWSWQYSTTWGLFYVAFISNALLVVLDWNTWVIPYEIRFLIGIPITVIGALLVTWGIVTLGIKNTYGLRNGFILSGPYCYTRNPQYLGDMILFIGIGLVSNSLYVAVVHLLMIVVFLFTPFTEEVWLEKQYGEEYRNYKKNTARFF